MMVRGLRNTCCVWERSDENNYSLVVNPARNVAIAVATGNDGTSGRSPDDQILKGAEHGRGGGVQPAAARASLCLSAVAAPSRPANRTATDDVDSSHPPGAGEVRCEVSLPISMGEDGRVDAWRERILLGSIPLDGDLAEAVPPGPPLPDIDVRIRRRA